MYIDIFKKTINMQRNQCYFEVFNGKLHIQRPFSEQNVLLKHTDVYNYI